MRVGLRGRTRRFDGGWSRGLGFGGARFGFRGRSRFSLRLSSFVCAKRFDARRFDARRLGGGRFFLRGQLRRGLSRTRGRSGLLFRRRLYVGRFATTTHGAVGADRLGDGRRLRRGRSATTRGRRRRCLLLRTISLLALPSRANTGDLIVGEHAHMASNRNVHLAEEAHDLVRGHCEFVCQFTH